MAGNFLEQIKRAREAAETPEPEATAKPIEELTDEELAEAERAARSRLLALQHQELRDREIARASGAGEAAERPRASGLAGILGSLQKKKRRNWR
jgi:hypothetical protein